MLFGAPMFRPVICKCKRSLGLTAIRRRLALRLFLIACVGAGTMLCLAGSISAQVDTAEGERALTKRNYPWYDESSQQVNRIEFEERAEARSNNRDEIPLKKTTAPPGPAMNLNFNWGWLDGLSVIAWFAIGSLVIVLLAVLVWAFLRKESTQELAGDASAGRSIAESIKQLPFDIESTNGDFRQLAQQAYSAGDYRKAMIYLFSHVLVSLDQKGLLRLRKGKTNRQYLRELKHHRPLADYYQRVMVPFEATFFGNHELNKQEFERCWDQLAGFQSGIEKSSQVANV